MINDNIRKLRAEKGMSQEELAVRLHVVRQTVSKWEKGLSVPDAQMVIEMADLLEVPVSRLLGTETADTGSQTGRAELTEELARLNGALAEKNRRETLMKEAGRKRGWILLLSFLCLFLCLAVDNPVFSAAGSGACVIAAVMILYRNLALMSRVTTEDMRLGVLRTVTVVNLGILTMCIITAILTAAGVLQFSPRSEKLITMLVIAAVMIFFGMISPKLPFTRHTGLRLPWTVQDEDTWNLAHRILGYISLPLALLYAGCSLTLADFEAVTLTAMALWIGIPAVFSLVFFRKKVKGKL